MVENDSIDRNQHQNVSRRKALTTVGGLASMSLGGCLGNSSSGNSSSGNSSSGNSNITLLTSESAPEQKEVLNNAGSAFKEKTGNSVDFEFASFEDIVNRLSQMLRGGDPPEILSGNTSVMGSAYVEDRLRPMTDIVNEVQNIIGNVSDGMLLQADGETWTLPLFHRMQNQTIRGDIIEMADSNINNMEMTWEDHLELVSSIDEKTKTTPIAVSTAQSSYSAQATLQYLWTNAVDVYSGSTNNIEIVMDKGKNLKKSIETINYLSDLHEYSPPATDWGWGEVGESFQTGEVADVNYSTGRLIIESKRRKQPWADQIQFVNPPKNGSFSKGYENAYSNKGYKFLTAANGLGLIDGAKNSQVAKEFIKFFYNNGHYIDFVNTVPFHNVPVSEDTFSDDQYLENKIIQEYPDILKYQKNLTPLATVPEFTADDGGFNPIAPTVYNEGILGSMLGRAIIQDQDPEKSVKKTAQEMRNIK